MESEIQLFLLSRKLLKSPRFRVFTHLLLYSSMLLTIFFISAFVCSNLFLISSQSCFLSNYKSLVFERDFKLFLKNRRFFYENGTMSELELEFYRDLFFKSRNFSLMPDIIYEFRVLSWEEGGDPTILQEFEVTSRPYLMPMSEEQREKHRFQKLVITVNCSSCFRNTGLYPIFLAFSRIFNMRTFFLSLLFTDFKSTVLCVKDRKTQKSEVWGIDEIKELVLLKYHINDIGFKTLISIRIAVTLFLLTGIIAILTRYSILFYPFFSYIIGWESPNSSRFRWVSLYFRLLTHVHKSRIWLFFAQILFIFFLMMIFALIPCVVQFMLITRKNSYYLSLWVTILVIIVDLYSLVFIRTRTSLKYFPVCFFLLLYVFLLYLNCNSYSFDFLGLYALYSLIFFLMSFFLKYAEYPAFETWPSADPNTPKLRTPRLLFNPVFSLAWINDSPPIWTIFLPSFGRGFFDRRHLAFVNNDVGALAVYRSENEDVGWENSLFSFDERRLVNMAGFAGDDIHYRL